VTLASPALRAENNQSTERVEGCRGSQSNSDTWVADSQPVFVTPGRDVMYYISTVVFVAKQL
jgi:hypothetical protein